MDNQSVLLSRPVRPALLAMAAPTAFGMLMTFLFQLVDTYFVGQLGTAELAAMSFSFPVYILMISLFMGTAAGVSASVGRALGSAKRRKAKQLTAVAVAAFMLLTIFISSAGLITVDPVFKALGADLLTLALVKQYMSPLYCGMFLLVGGLIANAALMAKGIMIKSTVIMAIGGCVNVIFDYLLIFGHGPFPAMALQGAAIATVLSWLTIFVLMLVLVIKEGLIEFSVLTRLRISLKLLSQIMAIASPAIAAQVLNPIAIAIVTRSIAGFGDSAIAAYGISTRIESLILVGIFSLSVVITPFVAQNFGAKQQQRLDQVLSYSGRMTVYWGLIIYILMIGFSDSITGIFTSDPSIITTANSYFLIIGITFPAFGLSLITSSFFNGVAQPKLSLKLTLIKSLGLTIPLALFGSLFGLVYIWVGIALANVIAAVYARLLLMRWLKDNNSELLSRSVLDDYKKDLKAVLTSA